MTEEIRFEDLPKVTKMMMTKLEELCAKMDKIIPTVIQRMCLDGGSRSG